MTDRKVKQRSEHAMQVSRGMNAVIPQIGFVIARDAIEKKADLTLEELELITLTAEQLSELIDVAAARENTAGLAYLLDLKNKRFTNYRVEDHLVLDW